MTRFDTCRSCGYSLVGLADDAECPECSTAVSASRASSDLAGADPAWLRRLLRGQRLLAIGAAAAIVTLLTCVAAGVTSAIGKGGAGALLEILFGVATVSGLCALFASTIGAVLASSQDPRESLRERTAAPRIVFRAALATAWLLVGIQLAARTVLPGLRSSIGSAGFAWIWAACFCVAFLAGFRWFGLLADRMQKPQLVERCKSLARTVHWALPGLLIAYVAGLVIPPAVPPAEFGEVLLGSLAPLLSLVCGLALLGVITGSCELLFALHSAMRAVWIHANERGRDLC